MWFGVVSVMTLLLWYQLCVLAFSYQGTNTQHPQFKGDLLLLSVHDQPAPSQGYHDGKGDGAKLLSSWCLENRAGGKFREERFM